MHIKTSMRYVTSHLSEWPSSINQRTRGASEDVEKGEPFCTLGENAVWCSHVANSTQIPPKIKNGSALCPNDPISENISEGTQSTNIKEHKNPCVHCGVIYDHQYMEATQVSVCRCMNKIKMRHLYNGILLGHKKESLPFATVWVDLKKIMLSEISQSEKNKCHMISLICGI